MELKKVCPEFRGSLVTEITDERCWMWNGLNAHYAGKGYRRLEFIIFMEINIRKETTCLYKKKTGSLCVELWRTSVYYIHARGIDTVYTRFEDVISKAIAIKGELLSYDVSTAAKMSILRKETEELKKNLLTVNKDIVVPHD